MKLNARYIAFLRMALGPGVSVLFVMSLAGCGAYNVAVNNPLPQAKIQFVHVANFSSDDVSTFAVNSATGTLTQVGASVKAGTSPVAAASDPANKFLYVANADSNDVSTFSIDPDSGRLTAVGSTVPAGT